MNKRVIALQGLFALSGFCGLIYESIWTQYLKLFVGHAAYAQSLVLAVFMGGLGLGAWFTAQWTGRIRNLLWSYALIEAVIGVAALSFHSIFGGVTQWAYASLLPATCAAEGLCVTQWLLAALLILPQSVLLGATFPLMTGGVLRLAPAAPGRKLALLYFLNSLGAVLGVLASGFVLIPAVGLPGALMLAGVANVLLAVAVYFLGKPGNSESAPGARSDARRGEPRWARTLLIASMLTGLSSFIYEIAWIRMLSMVLGSATRSFEIMLASFILGLALGGWWIRSRIDGAAAAPSFLAGVQIVMGVLALLTLPLYNYTFDAMAWAMSGLARSESAYSLYTGALTVLALVVMLPATFCAGMTLPLITLHLYRQGQGEQAIGRVYAANTLGAIVGVLLTVHVLMPLLGLKLAMVVGGVIDIGLGVYLLGARLKAPQSWPLRVMVAGALGFVALTAALVQFDPHRMGSSVFRAGRATLDASTSILFARDGKTATVQAARFANGVVAVSTNGKVDGTMQMDPQRPRVGDETTMVLTGALPLVYRPMAADVAVVGFGTGMSSATLLGSPHLRRLDTIEIEPAMAEAAQVFRPANERAYTDARHTLVVEDAKAHFARGQRQYDVIVSEPSNPWVSGVASLFTQEFYARAKRHLKDDGVLVQWIQLYEISPQLVASIFAALATSFPSYDAYIGASSDLIIVAGLGAKLPAPSEAVFGMPEVRALLERVNITSPDRLALHFVSNQRGLAPLLKGDGVHANSDYFPLVDQLGPKARFMQADAMALTQLHLAEVPLLRALDGRDRHALAGEVPPQQMSARLLPYERARQVAAYVREGVLPAHDRNYIADLEAAIVLRNRLFVCEGRGLADAPWDGVVRFGAETIPFLRQADAQALWAAVRASPCLRTFIPQQLRWLEMFEHVAAARWGPAGAVAGGLLDEPGAPSALQRRVLLQVATTALIVQGQHAAALAVLNAGLAKLPPAEREQGWARLLAAHARGAPAGMANVTQAVK